MEVLQERDLTNQKNKTLQLYIIAYILDTALSLIYFNYEFDNIRNEEITDLSSKQIILQYVALIVLGLLTTLMIFKSKYFLNKLVITNQQIIDYAIVINFVIQNLLFVESLSQSSKFIALNTIIKIIISIWILKSTQEINLKLFYIFLVMMLAFAQIRAFEDAIIPRIQLFIIIIIPIYYFYSFQKVQQQQQRSRFLNKECTLAKLDIHNKSTTVDQIIQSKIQSKDQPIQQQQISQPENDELKQQQIMINSGQILSQKKSSDHRLVSQFSIKLPDSANRAKLRRQQRQKGFTYCEFSIKKTSKLQFFLSLIDELPEGIVLINEKLNCINMNKKCKQIFNVNDENMATYLLLSLSNITLRNNEIKLSSHISSQNISKDISNKDNSQELQVLKSDENLKQKENIKLKSRFSHIHQNTIDQVQNNTIDKQQSMQNPSSQEKEFHSFNTFQQLDKPQMQEFIKINKIPLSTEKNVKDQAFYIFQGMANQNLDKSVQQIYSQQKQQIICQFGNNESNKTKILQIIFIPCSFSNEFCLFCIIKNITYIQRIDLLEKVNENKSKMLSQVAHEIRTPLNCIINMLDISTQCSSIEQAQQYIQPSLKSAKLLSNLIHDLLDIAQQKAGTFQLTLSKFHLKGLLYEIKDLMNLQAISQNLKLIIDYDSSMQEMIVTDQYRLRQIIINLLGNSLKYTKQGSISIIVRNFEGHQHIIEIKIKDTGLGIKKENLTKLFQAFSKIESEKDKQLNPQGVGLGLMISNMLVKSLEPENMNRGLSVQSELGQGTEFNFLIYDHNLVKKENDENRLESGKKEDGELQEVENEVESSHVPIYSQANTNQINTRLKDFQSMKNIDNQINSDFCSFEDNSLSLFSFNFKTKPCKCNKVLVVDDQQFNIITLQKMLSFYNIESDSVQSGIECEKICYNRIQQKCCTNYKLIFIDFDMPEQDGIQTTKKITNLFEANGIKNCTIIGCTGYSDKQVQQQGMSAGMKQIIEKPINNAELKIILNKFIFTSSQQSK